MKIIIPGNAVWRVNYCKYLKRVVFLSCLLLANLAQAEDCLLKKQLKDPYIKAEYEEIIAAYRTNNTKSDVENMYDTIQPGSFSEEAGGVLTIEIVYARDNIQSANISEEAVFAGGRLNSYLDPISKECVACHDGSFAKEAKHRVFSGYQKRTVSIETILGAHPVGMDYDQYRWNRQYVLAESFPADMVLMDGKVTCVTCHNLLGKNKKHLVVDNDGSRLCFSCHIK